MPCIQVHNQHVDAVAVWHAIAAGRKLLLPLTRANKQQTIQRIYYSLFLRETASTTTAEPLLLRAVLLLLLLLW
jgi:hypothetical protein